MEADLVVIGSGALARSVCYSLAVNAHPPAAVAVLARDRRQAEEVAHVAGTRAVLAGRAVAFHGRAADIADAGQLAEVLRETRPRIVLQCASWQSPWESRTASSPWTALVDRVGFGITLPLQARLAVATGQAMRAESSTARLVNACFPDAVNPLLAHLELPVLCGIGNVAILAAGLRAALGVPDGRLRVLAHHAHLHPPDGTGDDALAWVDDDPVPDVGRRLAGLRAVDRAELNQITGFAAARLLADLLAGRDVRTNLPGPQGRPGGYPVRITGGTLALDLPAGLSEAEAVAFNEHAAGLDGIRIDGGHVRLTAQAADRLGPGAAELAAGFAIEDTVAAAERLDAIRRRLRTP